MALFSFMACAGGALTPSLPSSTSLSVSAMMLRFQARMAKKIWTKYSTIPMKARIWWKKKEQLTALVPYAKKCVVIQPKWCDKSINLLKTIVPTPEYIRAGVYPGGHSNYFLTGVCLTKPWNGGLKSWLQAQNIGSLELHKPWNRSLGGLRSGLKPQNTWTLELPKTYGNPLFWILFWIWGCKARLEL